MGEGELGEISRWVIEGGRGEGDSKKESERKGSYGERGWVIQPCHSGKQ